MTSTQPSSDIETAIAALIAEQFGHGATESQVTDLVKQFKKAADIENETTNKIPD